MASNVWVKDALERAGHRQRDLATAWGISEGAVSRWIHGMESQDLPMSRGRSLARMLGMTLDELADRLGFGETPLPEPIPMPAGSPPLGSWTVGGAGAGRMTIMLHLDLPEKVGKQIVRLITADSDAI
jgi:hypothetical protein